MIVTDENSQYGFGVTFPSGLCLSLLVLATKIALTKLKLKNCELRSFRLMASEPDSEVPGSNSRTARPT